MVVIIAKTQLSVTLTKEVPIEVICNAIHQINAAIGFVSVTSSKTFDCSQATLDVHTDYKIQFVNEWTKIPVRIHEPIRAHHVVDAIRLAIQPTDECRVVRALYVISFVSHIQHRQAFQRHLIEFHGIIHERPPAESILSSSEPKNIERAFQDIPRVIPPHEVATSCER